MFKVYSPMLDFLYNQNNRYRWKMNSFLSSKACKIQKVQQLLYLPHFAIRGIHVSPILSKKHLKAGVFKISKNRRVELTYEEAKGPHFIGVQKSWLNWNSSNLQGEKRQAETLAEDAFIRKFVYGTWPGMFCTEIVIKRRYNTIIIAGFMKKLNLSNQTYFLIGYTEEILSLLLKCPVKLEIQTVDLPTDTVFKKI